MNKRLTRVFCTRVLQSVLSLALVCYLFLLVDWQAVNRSIQSDILYSFWPGPLIIICSLCVAAERWRLILAFFNVTLGRIEAVAIYLIGNFYSVLLPGVMGGDVARVAMCKARTRGLAIPILISVGIERGLGLWGVTLIGTLGSLSISSAIQERIGTVVLLIPLLLATGIPLSLLLACWFAAKLARLRLPYRRMTKVVQWILRLVVLAKGFPLPQALKTLLLSMAFQSSEIFIYFYFGHLLKIDVTFLFYCFCIPLVYLATVLPVSLGGLGVREGMLVWFLSMIGVSATDAVMLAFMVYLNRIVVAGVGGGVQLSVLLAKRHKALVMDRAL